MTEQSSAGGYDPMPAAGPVGPAVRGPAPSSVLTTVRLMYAGAALGLLGVLSALLTKSTLKQQIADNNTKLTPDQVNTALNAAIAVTIVIGVIVVVLYILLAMQVGKGKNWARIVTLVLTGLGVLFGLLGFLQPAPALSRIVSVIGLLLDIAIIWFLTRSESSAYFRGQPAR
jgi:hypothetical protein